MEQLQQLQQMYESLTSTQMYIAIGVLVLVVISIVMTAVYFMYPSSKSNKLPSDTNSVAQHSELPDIDPVDMVVSEIDEAQANEQQNHDGHNHQANEHFTNSHDDNENASDNHLQNQEESAPNSEQPDDVIEPIAQ